MEGRFPQVYEAGVDMAKYAKVETGKPRTSGRQMHRANAAADTDQDYYRINVAVVFLDHICNEMSALFSGKFTISSYVLVKQQVVDLQNI